MRIFVIAIYLFYTTAVFAWDLPAIPKNHFDFIRKYKFTAPVKPKNITKKKEEIKVSFHLNGIIKINENFIAIIDGKSYKQGEIVSNYKIVSINMDKVILEKNKKKVELYVGKN